MTIEFHCPYCQKLLRTGDDKAGVQANCPDCGERVTVPATRSDVWLADSPGRENSSASTGDSPPPKMTRCPMCGEEIPASEKRCGYCGEELDQAFATARRVAPHRGGLILALGILGWVVCFPFGIAAWVMGHNDLREMAAGRMDPQGEGLTRAGKIVGAIQCCLILVAIPIYLLIVGIAIFANAH